MSAFDRKQSLQYVHVLYNILINNHIHVYIHVIYMYTKHTVLSFHGYCDLNHSMDVMYIIHILSVQCTDLKLIIAV